jgi:DNA-binding CsgD family transcriptional regulator
MDDLKNADWRRIAALWGELSEIGVSRTDAAMEHARSRLGEILHAPYSWMVVQRRVHHHPSDSPPAVNVGGFTPVFIESFGADAERRTRIGRQWAAHAPNVALDPVVRLSMNEAGRRRSINQMNAVDRRTWDGSTVRRLLADLGSESRLVSILPLSAEIEVTFGFDRPVGEGVFRERDRQMVRAALEGMGSLAKSFARTRGLMPGQATLTPREREVLTHLLGPLSEKEIADVLDLSTGWLHQIVVSIYRKLGVRSRPELMALWLG